MTNVEFATIVSEHKELIDWLAARTFLQAAYGAQAYRLEAQMETNGYYDDEFYSDCFSTLNVFDQAGVELKPDLTLPYWKDILASSSHYRRYTNSDETAAKDRLFDHKNPPIAIKSAVYIVDQPPCGIPEVYLPTEGGAS